MATRMSISSSAADDMERENLLQVFAAPRANKAQEKNIAGCHDATFDFKPLMQFKCVTLPPPKRLVLRVLN